MEKTTELINIIASQDSKLTANSSELKEAFAAQNKEVTNKLDDVRDAIDTYALTASIGSDVGTIEAGISLKTLTTQLRELVQLQLASEREKRERIIEASGSEFSSLLQKEIQELKDENRNTLQELCLGIRNINKKLEPQIESLQSFEDRKKVDPLSEDLGIEKHYERIQQADFWSKTQTIVSVASIVTSTLVLIYEISK
jgi:hypothetical protein